VPDIISQQLTLNSVGKNESSLPEICENTMINAMMPLSLLLFNMVVEVLT
jgi:hypothetical protein